MNKVNGHLVCVLAAMAMAAGSSVAQTNGPPSRPDPKEIPVPEIETDLGRMPGVKALRVRNELPDRMVMNEGTRVRTPEQWKARRAEMRRILQYYAVGVMPPPPGNVKGTEVTNELVLNGAIKYR